MSQQQDHDAPYHREQVPQRTPVAQAVPADDEGELQQCQHDEENQQIDMPVIVVEELSFAVLENDLRKRDEETGRIIDGKHQQVKDTPKDFTAVSALFQKVQNEVVVSHRQHQHTQQRYMVPEIDGRP